MLKRWARLLRVPSVITVCSPLSQCMLSGHHSAVVSHLCMPYQLQAAAVSACKQRSVSTGTASQLQACLHPNVHLTQPGARLVVHG